MNVSLRRVLAGPVTLLTYALLVVPFAAGAFKTTLMTPLALPGYLIFVIGTAIGNALAPRFAFWLYWAPFLVGCYGISVVAGYGYEWWRTAESARTTAATGDSSSESPASESADGDRR